MRDEFGRNVQLPAEFAHIGDARGHHRRVANADPAAGHVAEGRVRDVVFGREPEHVARARAAQVDHAIGAAHVLERDRAVARHMSSDPAAVAYAEPGAGHDIERTFRGLHDREIGLDAALGIEKLGVDDSALALVDVAGGEPLQGAQRALARDLEFRERRHIDQRDAFADRLVLAADDRSKR